MRILFLLLLATSLHLFSFAQEEPKQDSSIKELEEVIISFNRWEQKLNEVPNKITKVSQTQILRNNPQTSADMLAQTGTVFIQKSQLGGGSPMIRGFSSNRVLLVIDGVRMNNAIYRSGNLQNIISIDALATETAEVIFGPGSLIYGSDAIGGVMDFHTLETRFSKTEKMLLKGNLFSRYSTANREKTVHADINFGWQKWSALTSLTYSSFNDLKMGKYGGQDNYLRTEYVERIHGTDSVIRNNDPRIQKFSGYNQLNFLQKIRFKPSKQLDVQYSFTYAATGDAPRYDRLIQYRNGLLRFADWRYGPMLWRMHNLQLLLRKKIKLYDELRTTIAYQAYEESRADRLLKSVFENKQRETVGAFNINADANKEFVKWKLYYGAEFVFNKVGSAGERINITDKSTVQSVSRYPDGSIWSTGSFYSSVKLNLHPKLTLTTGLRLSYNHLKATFDTTFIPFPFLKAELKEAAVTGNTGFAYRPSETWQLNANISSGYRMPNIDDLGKLFESAPGNVTVPNPDLKSEYAYNFEAGIIKNIPDKFKLEVNGFHTILSNAIVRRISRFNGKDSIFFDGVLSQVETLKNAAKATVWGVQLSTEIYFTKHLSLQSYANWITGKETDDNNNMQVPLRHAPPFYGSTFIRYRYNQLFIQASVIYNSEINNRNLAPAEQAKPEIYARDVNNKPYSPAWHTINLKASYQITKSILITTGIENITNQRYRSYSSGIAAAGFNFILAIRLSL